MLLDPRWFLFISLSATLISALVLNTNPSFGQVSNLTDFPLECYDPFTPIKPTSLEDCRELATGIMSLPPWGRPWVLSSVPGVKADKTIPLGIKHKSCHIRIIPIDDGAKVTDAFTARYFVHQLHKAINLCVTPWPHLGGEGEIGPKKVLALTVSGPFADKDDDSNDLVFAQESTPGDIETFPFRPPKNSTSQS